MPDRTVDLPAGLSTREWREAQRAMRGAVLRREVYALDDSRQMDKPFSISVPQWRIEKRQKSIGPPDDVTVNWAVFQRLESGSVTYTLDRVPEDPRIGQSLVLEWDAFGTPIRRAAIGHARANIPSDLPAPVAAAQAKTSITFTETTQIAEVLADETAVPRTLWKSGTGRHLPRGFELAAFDVMGVSLSGLVTAEALERATDDLPEVDYSLANHPGPAKRCTGRSRRIYLADDLSGPLPPGQAGILGLLHHSEVLAQTAQMVQTYYEGKIGAADMQAAGYVHGRDATSAEDEDHWTVSGTSVYGEDAADRFYLPAGHRDPFGAETSVEMDDHLLLPTRTIDAAGLETLAINDYRVLGPRMVRDPNGNWSAALHDGLGQVVASAAMGQISELLTGDPTGFETCDGDNLAHPTRTFDYEIDRWADEGKPVRATGRVFETHHFAGDSSIVRKSLISHEYSDGFGNIVMSKVQAAPGKAQFVDDNDTLQDIITTDVRWIGNGRTILNNKGQPIRQFEPYFSTTPEFEDHPLLVEQGVSGIVFYDAAGRRVGGFASDGTWGKEVVTPWRSESWDAADTCLIDDPDADETLGGHFSGLPPDLYHPGWYAARQDGSRGDQARLAAEKSAAHAATPSISHTDALGRVIWSEGFATPGEPLAAQSEMDIEGNTLSVTDARDNVVMRYAYSMLPPADEGTPKPHLREDSMDRGRSMMLNDVMGRPYLAWDARGHMVRATYDTAGRPSKTYLTQPGAQEICIQVIEYGEAAPDATSLNLLGKPWRTWDQSGLSELSQCDCKGNALVGARRFLKTDVRLPVDLGNAAARIGLLESDTYIANTTFDAMNRPTRSEAPHTEGMTASVTEPEYDEGGALASVSVTVPGGTFPEMVKAIDYDAKGQRQSVEYGNDTRTEYEYDPESYRLTRLVTRHQTNGKTLQDLNYTYDAVGNITHIRDDAQQDIYFDNSVIRPDQTFSYDALYRLTRAEGREHADQAGSPGWRTGWEGRAHPQDGGRMRNYIQTFAYDTVGNIETIQHSAGAGSWTRNFDYDATSNRLLQTTLGSAPAEVFSYNEQGSMTRMNHLDDMVWNHAEQLARVDKGTEGSSDYTYDGTGERVRKRRTLGDGRVQDRLYFGGFEIYRELEADGSVTLTRETLHVADDIGRIAMIETKTVDAGNRLGTPVPLVRYQLGNHLGSAALELDGAGGVISYEEYHPYGTTSYYAVDSTRDVPPKRYRYTGKERDEETGFSYHSAR
ncbi:MAG: toxin TcdB middle/C-terminal domain-containing protein, partial [Pseudomonadota bacterium]